jgi:ParB family chromosome partitioning protein
MGEFGLTQDAVASSVGKDRSSIANLLRLLGLPKEVQQFIESGALSLGHAKVLAGVSSPSTQLQIAKRIVSEQLSVRQTEQLIVGQKSGGPQKHLKAVPNKYQHLEDQLRRHFGTKVLVKAAAKGGQLIIHYYSDEELDRVSGIILE